MAWGNENSKTKSYGDTNKNKTSLTTSTDHIKKGRKKQTKSEKFWENAIEWVYYWRNNPHRFAEEVIGVQLKLFQKIFLYAMNMKEVGNFTWIASRGTGKSFLIALFAIIRCILYPNTKITIASGVRTQSIQMIKQYCQFFYNEYPILRDEIKEISSNVQDPKVIFFNGSTIRAVTANDNARGKNNVPPHVVMHARNNVNLDYNRVCYQ